MTVIYANWGDEDTKRFSVLLEGLNANVIEVNISYPSNSSDVEKIREAMYSETDTLLFCGHGSAYGLFNPSQNTLMYDFIFSKRDLEFVKAKNIIGIWCYAKNFSQLYNVKGFFSSMFISNYGEACCSGIYDVPEKSIFDSITMFCNKVNALIKDNIPLNTWVQSIQEELLTENSTAVEKFNYNNLYYNGDDEEEKSDKEL